LKNKSARAWAPTALYGAAIFLGSALPGSSPILWGVEKYVWDKLLHLLEYIPLGILLLRALALTFKGRSLWTLMFVAVALGGLYAVSDEWHQSFVPLRCASVHDWMGDVLGVFAGAYAWRVRLVGRLKAGSD